MVRRLGYTEKRFGKSPKQLAKMTQRQATNFLLDMVSSLESEKRSGSYISNCVKPVKSWLDFNGITIQQRIKISGRDELTKFAEERTPTSDELRRILNAADLRAKAACSLVAFSRLRLEVLGVSRRRRTRDRIETNPVLGVFEQFGCLGPAPASCQPSQMN